MRPCPFSDMALGHQWCAGSSRKGVAASELGLYHLSSVVGVIAFNVVFPLEGWGPTFPSYSSAPAA